jgi:HAMP domain-containing protein
VLVTALVVEINGRADASRATSEQLRRARTVVSGRLTRDGENLQRLSATVARDPKFFALLALRRSERTATFRQSLDGVVREFQSGAGVEIFDVTDEWGATVAASTRPAAPEASRGTSPLVRSALAGKPALGFRLEGGRLYRVAVTPILAGGKAPIGTLTVGSPLDETLAQAVRGSTGADLLIVASAVSPSGKAEAARPIVTTLSVAGARSVLETAGPPPRAGERARFQAGQPVSIAKTPALAVDIPFDGAMEGGTARLLAVAPLALESSLGPVRETLLAAGALAAVVSLIVGFLVGRRMSRRLLRLGAAAREAEIGNYDLPLPPPGRDEVGVLTADFAAMREAQRREISRLVETDKMKSDFLGVTAQAILGPVEEIQSVGDTLATHGARALGPEGLRRLRVIRENADMLAHVASDLESASVTLSPQVAAESAIELSSRAKPKAEAADVITTRGDFQPAVRAEEPVAVPAPALPPAPPVASAPALPPAPPAPTLPPAPAASPSPVAAGRAADVAQIVESVAVDLIVAGAERGIEVGIAVEHDLRHPSVDARALEDSLRRHGDRVIAELTPGSTVTFLARRTEAGIEVRIEGGPTPLQLLLPFPAESNLPLAS